ncbi:hypothetical protein FHJ30_05430 [Arthrobacter sp. BB-1]|uniref:hypothetical protein n=1 Tax=unclassified Arthrobacter TaxID=235627 RepID=UPI001112174E|nr:MULTISPECIES: hypothetical protein [unclassified Arthrobacter]TNB74628.1 hypothetical protein FHJ30_05430 [Arthrobacter sp. BB-1]
MKSIRAQASDVEQNATLGQGGDERFSGYGVMGLPFSSGHVLAMRRFPVTSVGPGYRSVWLRRPSGSWTIYADAPPQVSCARYFGAALESAVEWPIEVAWTGDAALSVRVGGDVGLAWDVELGSTPVTRAMTAALTSLPGPVLENTSVLKVMGAASGPVLRAGRLGLTGAVPNRQGFRANPGRMWFVSRSTASLEGEDLGAPHPLRVQARLGDFFIPQRGIFLIGASSFDRFDPARHLPAAPRQ